MNLGYKGTFCGLYHFYKIFKILTHFTLLYMRFKNELVSRSFNKICEF